MKNKKLLLPGMILAVGILAAVLLSLFLSAAEKPTVTEYSFPFSITYEFGGKTETIRDEFVCTYLPDLRSNDPKQRMYEGVLSNRDGDLACGDYLIQGYDNGELVIFTNLFAGYLMGDAQYDGYYTEYHRCEPLVAFYDHAEYREFDDEETLAPYGVKIVSWEYPDPIENTFVFSGITRLTSRHIVPLLLVALATALACILFVKKDPTLPTRKLDTASRILNIVIALAALPFLTVFGHMIDIIGNGSDPLSQIIYCLPAITAFGLAASLSLRRKGFSKSGFAAQFAGIAAIAAVLCIDLIR